MSRRGRGPIPRHYNDAMFAVRYAALAALVVWLGGMVLLGLVVAPSTFRVLQAHDPAGGRVLAGALFGTILRQFHVISYICGFLILVSLVALKLIGPPPAAFPARAALVALMLGLAVYSGVPVTHEIEQLQSEVTGPISALPDTDPRRIRFDRLHATSTTLMTINMALGLVLLYWYARE
jgi:uncharacterized membrane protein